VLITIISIIEWAKLITGLSLVITGCILFIRPFLGTLTASTMNIEIAGTYAVLLGTGLACILTGFYIAGW
jgi:hypothetical protein